MDLIINLLFVRWGVQLSQLLSAEQMILISVADICVIVVGITSFVSYGRRNFGISILIVSFFSSSVLVAMWMSHFGLIKELMVFLKQTAMF